MLEVKIMSFTVTCVPSKERFPVPCDCTVRFWFVSDWIVPAAPVGEVKVFVVKTKLCTEVLVPERERTPVPCA